MGSAIVLSQLLKLLVVLLDTGTVPAAVIDALNMRQVVNALCADSRVLVKELAVAIVTTKLPAPATAS